MLIIYRNKDTINANEMYNGSCHLIDRYNSSSNNST